VTSTPKSAISVLASTGALVFTAHLALSLVEHAARKPFDPLSPDSAARHDVLVELRCLALVGVATALTLVVISVRRRTRRPALAAVALFIIGGVVALWGPVSLGVFYGVDQYQRGHQQGFAIVYLLDLVAALGMLGVLLLSLRGREPAATPTMPHGAAGAR
jgi:hypothetical protein